MRKILSGALALVILCASAMYCAHSRVLAVNATNNDKQLLARAVNGEARGEPYEGQVAVAAVILNRVRHSSFPNTISGVIYQPGAFTAVSDGQINVPIDRDKRMDMVASAYSTDRQTQILQLGGNRNNGENKKYTRMDIHRPCGGYYRRADMGIYRVEERAGA